MDKVFLTILRHSISNGFSRQTTRKEGRDQGKDTARNLHKTRFSVTFRAQDQKVYVWWQAHLRVTIPLFYSASSICSRALIFLKQSAHKSALLYLWIFLVGLNNENLVNSLEQLSQFFFNIQQYVTSYLSLVELLSISIKYSIYGKPSNNDGVSRSERVWTFGRAWLCM